MAPITSLVHCVLPDADGSSWIILDCYHWYHWGAAPADKANPRRAPLVGSQFPCPDCQPPIVVTVKDEAQPTNELSDHQFMQQQADVEKLWDVIREAEHSSSTNATYAILLKALRDNNKQTSSPRADTGVCAECGNTELIGHSNACSVPTAFAALKFHPVQQAYQEHYVPRAVAMRAYEVYKRVYGEQPAMITGHCRGGFAYKELIAFLYAYSFPLAEWKQRVEEAFERNPASK